MQNQDIREWLHLTTSELDALDRKLPVILPFGSIEAHGHHLPVGTDVFICEKIAREACAQTGAILLPGVPFTFLSGSTKNYVGGIDMPAEHCIAMLKPIVASVHRNGFKNIIIFNGHGANRFLLEIVVRTLLDDHEKTGLKLQYRSWWDDICRVHHACEVETSVLIAIQGETVLRKDKIKDNINHYKGWRMNDWAKEMPLTGGVNGSPSKYNVEEGKKIYRASVDNLIALIKDARENW